MEPDRSRDETDTPASAGPGSRGSRLARPVKWILLLALPPLAFATLYTRALDYEFVWTDRDAIGQRTLVRPAGELLQAFREPLHRVTLLASGAQQPFYRPLHVVLLSAVAQTTDASPRAYRTASVGVGCLYATAVGLFAWFLFGWARGRPREEGREPARLALWAALLVAVHPVAIESTVWIAGASGTLCALFVVIAVGVALRAAAARTASGVAGLAALSTLALVAGLLAKERAAVEPVLLLAGLVGFRITRGPETRAQPRFAWPARSAAIVLIHAVVVAAYVFWWRPAVLGGALTGLPPLGGSATTQLATALASWPRQIAWLFLPFRPTTNDGVALVTSFADPRPWLGIALALGSAAAWLLLLRAGRPVAAFGLAWVWIAYLPTAGLVPMLHPRADRYLFLSALGAGLAIADLAPLLLRRLPRETRRWLAPALASLVVVLVGGQTWARIGEWQSTQILFETEVARDPNYREGRFLLANEYFRAGRYQEADDQLGVLLADSEEREHTAGYLNELLLYDLACLNALALARHQEVLALERRVVQRNAAIARVPSFRTCVGQAKQALGREREALAIFVAVARELGPRTPWRLHLMIAEIHARQGHTTESLDSLERVMRAAPGDPNAAREVQRLRRRLGARS